MSWMVLALAGSRSISFLWVVNSKNFFEETPKSHFRGFIRKLYCLHLVKFFNHMVTLFLEFHNDVNYIIFEPIMAYIVKKNKVHW